MVSVRENEGRLVPMPNTYEQLSVAISRHNTFATTTVISSSSSAVILAPKVVASSMRAETIASAEVSEVN